MKPCDGLRVRSPWRFLFESWDFVLFFVCAFERCDSKYRMTFFLSKQNTETNSKNSSSFSWIPIQPKGTKFDWDTDLRRPGVPGLWQAAANGSTGCLGKGPMFPPLTCQWSVWLPPGRRGTWPATTQRVDVSPTVCQRCPSQVPGHDS